MNLEKGFWSIVARLSPYKREAILNMLFNIFAVLFSLVSLVMIVPFLRILFNIQDLVITPPIFEWSSDYLINHFNYTLSSIIIERDKVAALFFVCLIIILVFLLKNLFRYAAIYFMAIIRNGVVRDIRKAIFDKIMLLPIGYFSEKRKGDLLTRVTADVQEIEWSIMSTLEVTVKEPITVIAYLGAMLLISWELTLFVLVVLPISGVIIGRVGKTLKSKSHIAQKRLSNIMSIIEESLSGLRIIKGFNGEVYQSQRFGAQNQAHFEVMTDMSRRRDLASPLSEVLSITVVAIVLYFGGRMVLGQTVDLEAELFITFMVIFSQILTPAKAFSKAFYNIQKGIASVERVNAILSKPNTISDPSADVSKRIQQFQKHIIFQNVSFAYNPEQLVLQNVDLQINKGEIVALVGASGAGKSTLVDLIPRFYDPTNGTILVDDENIKNYPLNDLRSLMGIVTQDPILFNDTVLNNICFGTENISHEEVIQAAKIANAHEFIEQFSEGYDTNIGDSGVKLSGGQRQRLTIARAVLKNPPILILDEATSSLDAASEKLVQDALFKLMQNRTSIVIAHRLNTIQAADKIVVLQAGRIVEQGKHEDLIQKNGYYKRLVELQMNAF